VNGERGTTDHNGGAARVAVFIAFVPLAFSEDFLEAAFGAVRRGQPQWALLAADAALLGVIFWLRRKLIGAHDRRLLGWWWAGGAALTLVLDAAVTWNWVLHATPSWVISRPRCSMPSLSLCSSPRRSGRTRGGC
jgi:hypothetical protein